MINDSETIVFRFRGNNLNTEIVDYLNSLPQNTHTTLSMMFRIKSPGGKTHKWGTKYNVIIIE